MALSYLPLLESEPGQLTAGVIVKYRGHYAKYGEAVDIIQLTSKNMGGR